MRLLHVQSVSLADGINTAFPIDIAPIDLNRCIAVEVSDTPTGPDNLFVTGHLDERAFPGVDAFTLIPALADDNFAAGYYDDETAVPTGKARMVGVICPKQQPANGEDTWGSGQMWHFAGDDNGTARACYMVLRANGATTRTVALFEV